jgi:ribonucleotide reductase beta subunit family protein with ferritin-like domain
MKDFWIVFIILVIVFGGNYFIHGYIEETGKEFLEEVSGLVKSINSSDEIKKQIVGELLKTWENNEEKWIMIGYHQEINNIEDLLIECYNYYLQDKKEDFNISYQKLKRNIEDLRNRERITFTNIL